MFAFNLLQLHPQFTCDQDLTYEPDDTDTLEGADEIDAPLTYRLPMSPSEQLDRQLAKDSDYYFPALVGRILRDTAIPPSKLDTSPMGRRVDDPREVIRKEKERHQKDDEAGFTAEEQDIEMDAEVEHSHESFKKGSTKGALGAREKGRREQEDVEHVPNKDNVLGRREIPVHVTERIGATEE